MKVLHLGRTAWALALGATLMVGLLGWQGFTYEAHRQDHERRAEAMATAKAQVQDLISLNSHNVGARLKSLEGRTTGDFNRQLRGLTEVFVGTVEKQEISADGRVVGVGIDTISSNEAEVLVAATTNVSSAKAKDPTARGYRLRITLKRVHDRWLVNNMEFVA